MAGVPVQHRRANRAHGILARGLIYLVISVLSFIVILQLLLTFNGDLMSITFYVGAGLLFILVLFSAIAVGIKRLHDRDKSGWWAILFMVLPMLLNGASRAGIVTPSSSMVLQWVSLALAIWGIVEFGFLRGTVGPNQFGPDPLQQGD